MRQHRYAATLPRGNPIAYANLAMRQIIPFLVICIDTADLDRLATPQVIREYTTTVLCGNLMQHHHAAAVTD